MKRSKQLGIEQTKFSYYIKKLTKANILVKYPCPEEGRVSLFGLSIKAKKVKEKLEELLD